MQSPNGVAIRTVCHDLPRTWRRPSTPTLPRIRATSDARLLTQTKKVKASAALPVHQGRDTTLLAIHDLSKTRSCNSCGVFACFNTNKSSVRFQRDGSCGARPKVRIQDQISRVARDLNNPRHERFRFWRIKRRFSGKKSLDVLLCVVVCTHIVGRPKRLWRETAWRCCKKLLEARNSKAVLAKPNVPLRNL